MLKNFFGCIVFRFLIILRILLMAIYGACENSPDTIPVIFPGASPSRGEIEYRTKVILGEREKYNLNAAWSGESKLHTRNARSSTPLRTGIILRQPLLHSLPVSSPSSRGTLAAQHMHTKYIKRPAPVPKYGVVYSRVVQGRERRAPRLVRLCEGLGCTLLFSPRWHDVDVVTSRSLIAKRSNCEHITVIVKMENKTKV